MRKFLYFLTFSAFISCSVTDSPEPGVLLPIAKGNQWVYQKGYYRDNIFQPVDTFIYRISDVISIKIDSAYYENVGVFEWFYNDSSKVDNRKFLLANLSDGLYNLAIIINGDTITNVFLEFKYPAKDDEEYFVRYLEWDYIKNEWTLTEPLKKTVRFMTFDTPIKNYQTYCYIIEIPNDVRTWDYSYYVPGLGYVGLDEIAGSSMTKMMGLKLIDYTIN